MESSNLCTKPNCKDHLACIRTKTRATSTYIQATTPESEDNPPDVFGTYASHRGILVLPYIVLFWLAELAFTTLRFIPDPITGCMFPEPDSYQNFPYALYRTRDAATGSGGYYFFTITYHTIRVYVYLHQLFYVLSENCAPAIGCQLLHFCSQKCSNHIILGGK